MPILLRLTALLSLVWAIGLIWSPFGFAAELGATPLTRALANGLAVANLAFAYLFWRAAASPASERGAIYAALVLLGLRAASGLYEVLYLLDGRVAVPSLIDMVLSLGLFVGIINALPAALGKNGKRAADDKPQTPG